MNLLELLRFYQMSLQEGQTRTWLREELSKMGVEFEVIIAIERCFDDEGNALHTIPREDEKRNPVVPFVEDDDYGGFQFAFEKTGEYRMG